MLVRTRCDYGFWRHHKSSATDPQPWCPCVLRDTFLQSQVSLWFIRDHTSYNWIQPWCPRKLWDQIYPWSLRIHPPGTGDPCTWRIQMECRIMYTQSLQRIPLHRIKYSQCFQRTLPSACSSRMYNITRDRFLP